MNEIENFSSNFFDIRTNKMQPGQVLARFRAVCEIINGPEKKHFIQLLQKPDSSQAVINYMKKVFQADDAGIYRIPAEMSKDLLTMTEEEVLEKSYEYTIELFYWTSKEYVPDDSHWEIIDIIDVHEQDDQGDDASHDN